MFPWYHTLNPEKELILCFDLTNHIRTQPVQAYLVYLGVGGVQLFYGKKHHFVFLLYSQTDTDTWTCISKEEGLDTTLRLHYVKTETQNV